MHSARCGAISAVVLLQLPRDKQPLSSKQPGQLASWPLCQQRRFIRVQLNVAGQHGLAARDGTCNHQPGAHDLGTTSQCCWLRLGQGLVSQVCVCVCMCC